MKRFSFPLFVPIFYFLFSIPAIAGPNLVVLGYSAVWFDGLYPPESYNYGALTHIARAFLTPKADGSIKAPAGFWDPDLQRLAQAHGVKLLASLGGAAPDASQWLALARDPKALKVFFDSLEKSIGDHRYDGVDVDWEPSALTDQDQETYTAFMKELRARFPKWIITTALGASDYYGKHIAWADVARQVDFINLMTYDFAGDWTGHSGYNANLYDSKNSKVATGLSVDEAVKRLEGKYSVPADKIVLGLPFYGQHFFTAHMGDNFTDAASKVVSEIQFYEIAPLELDGDWKFRWDDDAKADYLERAVGNGVISYDDKGSIRNKCDYAKNEGLRGVMIWNLGADLVGLKTPLLDSVCGAFGARSVTLPASGLARAAATFAGMVQDAFGKLGGLHENLLKAGKIEEAGRAVTWKGPELSAQGSNRAGVLGKEIWDLQRTLSKLNRKLEEGQAVLDSIPVTVVQGRKVEADGARLLVDDFEGGTPVNALGGAWTADFDQNKLGTTLSPSPFAPAAGGARGSEKFAAHIFGHFGKSMAPWPYAELTGTLNQAGAAADISGFKTLKFWAKGDGKEYSALLGRAAVRDYCNFRSDFMAPIPWTEVVLNLQDFKQPTWGRQIPLNLSDVLYIEFTPSASFSDEDFNLWVDDVVLGK